MTVDQYLKTYSRDYANKVCEQAYQSKNTLSGEDILSLTPIKQINLFVIKNLMLDWRKELKKLDSPFFDFQHAEVKQALNQFGNTLSRYISLKKGDCSVLLEKSTFETLLLLFRPYNYFKQIIEYAELQKHTVPEFKEYSRYIKINRTVLENFISGLEEQGGQTITQGGTLLDSVFEKISISPEDPGSYLDSFASTIPLDKNKLHEDDGFTQDQQKEIVPANPIPVIQDTPKIPLTATKSTKQAIDDGGQKTLNDTFSDESRPTLADIHQYKKIDSIKKSLTLNQKFMFINNLFDGNAHYFEETIDQLERMGSMGEATQFINKQFQWDTEMEETLEFMELLRKRFG